MNTTAFKVGQRVMLITFLPHTMRPLYAGDMGTVMEDNDGDLCVQFDRYAPICICQRRSVAGVTRRVVELCTLVEDDGQRAPVLPVEL